MNLKIKNFIFILYLNNFTIYTPNGCSFILWCFRKNRHFMEIILLGFTLGELRNLHALYKYTKNYNTRCNKYIIYNSILFIKQKTIIPITKKKRYKIKKTCYGNGNAIKYNQNKNKWVYIDDNKPRRINGKKQNRPCPKCGKLPTKEGHDACLGEMKGVINACCGHNNHEGYIDYENGNVIRFRTDNLTAKEHTKFINILKTLPPRNNDWYYEFKNNKIKVKKLKEI